MDRGSLKSLHPPERVRVKDKRSPRGKRLSCYITIFRVALERDLGKTAISGSKGNANCCHRNLPTGKANLMEVRRFVTESAWGLTPARSRALCEAHDGLARPPASTSPEALGQVRPSKSPATRPAAVPIGPFQ